MWKLAKWMNTEHRGFSFQTVLVKTQYPVEFSSPWIHLANFPLHKFSVYWTSLGHIITKLNNSLSLPFVKVTTEFGSSFLVCKSLEGTANVTPLHSTFQEWNISLGTWEIQQNIWINKGMCQGTWMTQSVERWTLAQVMISWFMSSSPTLSWLLSAQSPLQILSFSLCPSPTCTPSKINKTLKKECVKIIKSKGYIYNQQRLRLCRHSKIGSAEKYCWIKKWIMLLFRFMGQKWLLTEKI